MMQKLLIGGLLLASPLMAQRPVMVRVGSNRIKLTEKAFALRDGTHSDAYVPMTAEMMAAGFWEYFKLMYDRYGYIKRGPEHKDRFIHEDQFYFCLADNYFVHNFVKGDRATKDTDLPYFQKTTEANAPLKVHLYDQNKNQIKADSGSILEDNIQFSKSTTKCKGDSGLWIMKTIYDRMAPHIPTDGVVIEPLLVEGDGSVTLSCDTCMALLEEEKTKVTDLTTENDDLKKELADIKAKYETCESSLESCNENSSNSDCTDVEEELATCKSDKETCEDNLESCTSGNSDACKTCQDDLEQCQQDKEECDSNLETCTNSSGQNDECQEDLTECESKLTECNAGSDRCNTCESELTKCQDDLTNAEDDCNDRIATCQSERDTCNADKEECNSTLSSCQSNNKCVGGLEPIGNEDFDNWRANLDYYEMMNWHFYWVDIITSPEVKNVVFARIPQIGSKGSGQKCKDIGMVYATVRGDDEDELLYQWHSNYVRLDAKDMHKNFQHRPAYGLLGSLTAGASPAKQRYWYWSLGADGRNGLYGEWGSEGYDLGYETYSHSYLKYPSIPVEKCYFRGNGQYDAHGCSYIEESVNVVYTSNGWGAHRYTFNNWDALCEWRAPVNVARDFKIPDTTDCFELEDAAQKYVRYFSCPWIKSDKAYITTKCEDLGMNLASVRSDAEIKALNNAAKFEAGNVYPTSAEYSNYNWKWGDASQLVIDDISWSDNGARGNPGSTTELKVGNGNVVPVEPGFGQYSVLCEVRQEPPVVVEETSE